MNDTEKTRILTARLLHARNLLEDALSHLDITIKSTHHLDIWHQSRPELKEIQSEIGNHAEHLGKLAKYMEKNV